MNLLAMDFRWSLSIPEVSRKVDRAEKKVAAKQLAYIRSTVRRRVLRRRKKSSKAPKPPSVHSRDSFATLKNVRFDVNKGIVGIVKANQKQVNWIEPGVFTVPEIHEKGAVILVHEQAWASAIKKDGESAWTRRDMRRSARVGMRYRKRRAIYRPRPMMSTALQMEIDKGTLPAAWAGAVQ